jgi:hypothetical protein
MYGRHPPTNGIETTCQNSDEPREEASELQGMDVEAKDAMKESSESRRLLPTRLPKHCFLFV